MIKSQSSTKRFSAVLATAALVLSGTAGISAPAFASDTKKLTISGFAPNSVALTASMKQRIDRFINANDEFLFVSCVGFADRAGSATTNNALGKGRAKAGCDQAISANSEAEVVSSRGRWDRIRSGASVRRVEITLSNSTAAVSSNFTTSFEYAGGEQGVTEGITLADGTLVLPTPTRPGYVFLGWFNQIFDGTKIGNGGDTYRPDQNRVLWAQWLPLFSGGGTSAPVGGGSSSSASLAINFSLWVDIPGITQANIDDGRTEFTTADIQQAVNDFCAASRTVTVSVVVDGGATQEFPTETVESCSPSTAGILNFSETIPGPAPQSTVRVLLSFSSGGMSTPSGWETTGDGEFYIDLNPSQISTVLSFTALSLAA